MSYCVRLMRREDVEQVIEISHEAFPTEWPPRNYRHELQNQSARYAVAIDDGKVVERSEVKTSPGKPPGLVSRIRRFFTRGYPPDSGLLPSEGQYIVGFAGLWVIAGEAHITDIAVREVYRRRGIGELLLIACIDMATDLDSTTITLEVRVSNITAQRLYSKYGFTQVGLRRGYYTDNREDAMLMTTENITSASFKEHLQQLQQALSRKWGINSIDSLLSCRLTGRYPAQPDR
ncbi:MAG: ribosomal protein S18-alanine N-acetyltransferase [Dehalococcoidales bacterium]|nr:ribosomal protein S18-alanine N-acetyltransferase [Dehalococcoidales bacterium]